MKRAVPVLLAILLGALATAIGMGIFLKLANDDRARLGTQIEQARLDAEQAVNDKERIANEANQKVQAANDEVAKAQKVLQALEDQQRLLAEAKQLAKPSGSTVRGWQSTISFPLKLSLLLPPKTAIQTNDAESLTAVRVSSGNATSSTTIDARWFSVMPYNEARSMELLASLSTSTRRAYLVGGRLLTGASGLLMDGSAMTVLEIHQAASTTHVLWIKDPGTLGNGGIERLLSTFEFAS